MTIDDMREKLRILFAGGGRNNAVDALTHRINRLLMVFNNRLYDLETGESVVLPDQPSQAPGSPTGADLIAEAAATLLGARRSSNDAIQLLLPPSEFFAQTVSLPGLSRADMQAALRLQSATRLPEQEQELAFCLSYSPQVSHDSEAIAWWLPKARADQLFAAMAAHSLFLVALLPRPAWLLQVGLSRDTATIPVLLDEDEHMQTVLGCQREPLGDARLPGLASLQTARADLDEPDVAQAWQTELAQHGLSDPGVCLRSADDYLRFMRAHNLALLNVHISRGAVFPDGALAASHQLDRGKRRVLLVRAAAAILAIMMLPGLYQSWQLSSLEAELAQLRLSSTDARANQAAVRDFESQWGVLTEFPAQDVTEVMLALQQVINPGVLSAFSIDEARISIEGESQDPQNVLEMLEQNPLFTEVDFARATTNNRYFIDLRLSTVNFPAYQEWYFPEQR